MDRALTLLALGLLTALAVFGLGAAVLASWARKREGELARRRVLQAAPEGEAHKEAAYVGWLARLGGFLSAGRFSRQLQQDLAHAGFHGSNTAAIYLGSKILLFLGGIACGIALFALASLPLVPACLAGMCVALVLFLTPNVVVSIRRRRRRDEIQRRLPDAVDLIEVCVSSGMGLDMAWHSVTDEIRRVSRVLADEMELTRLEISLGIPRTEAMRHMAQRTGADEISSLVALLVQSERFGASIAEALTTFAQSMREIQSRRAEESAEKMAVKLLFPMVLFIFPALLIVMVGPAVMNIVDVML
jgi:tight adherence protein C